MITAILRLQSNIVPELVPDCYIAHRIESRVLPDATIGYTVTYRVLRKTERDAVAVMRALKADKAMNWTLHYNMPASVRLTERQRGDTETVALEYIEAGPGRVDRGTDTRDSLTLALKALS